MIGWSPPENLGSPLVHYVMTWAEEQVTGHRAKEGGRGERLLLVTDDSTEVTDLAMGQSYSFRVKVSSTSGCETCQSSRLLLRAERVSSHSL